ncbi:MAG: hypothetical protein Q8Q15_00165 [bacterium]|nr:hypothetical protein [bacterium]
MTEICRVFKDQQKSRKRFLKQGRDPDSLESVFECVEENFAKTRKLLERGVKKWGIDLSSLESSDELSPPEPEEFPLYRLVCQYSQQMEDLIKDLGFIPPGTNTEILLENIEIIDYYHALFPAKIYRACFSRWEEQRDPEDTVQDSKTSAFIAINGLIAVAEALANLAEHPPLLPFARRMIRLGRIATNLGRTLTLEFELKTKEN